MKVCGGCTHEFEEQFNFCPDCGRKFGGGEAAEQLKRALDQNLYDTRKIANYEAQLSRRVFSGNGLGDSVIPGRVFGASDYSDL